MEPLAGTSKASGFRGFDHEETELQEATIRKSDMANEKLLISKNFKKYEEPPCCKVCLSTRLAMLTVSCVFLITVMLVLVLDLVIMEAERTTRREYYRQRNFQDRVDEILTRNTEPPAIVLQGSPRNYQVYSHTYTRKATVVLFNHVEISVKNLEHLLDNHSNSLKEVLLNNIRLKGLMASSPRGYRRVYMNALQTYTLKLNQPIGPGALLQLDLCDNCVMDNSSKYTGDPFASFQDPECFKHLIPFTTTRSNYAYSENVFDLILNLTLVLNDWTYFKIDYKTGEVTSMLKHSNEMLQSIPKAINFPFVLKKLNLKRCNLESKTLSLFSGSLTHLFLDTVNVTDLQDGVPISQILIGLTKLEQLTLKNSPFTKYYDATAWAKLGVSANMFDLLSKIPRKTVELSHLPTTLKNLTLSDYELTWNNAAASESTLNFNLDRLIFHRVNFMNYSILTNFQKLFTCRKFAFQPWDHRIKSKDATTGNVNYFKIYEWFEILNKVQKGDGDVDDWIFIDNIFTGNNWHSTDASSNSIIELFNTNNLSPTTTTAFVLDRKKHASYWEVEDIGGKDRAQLVWFKMLQMDTFTSLDLGLDAAW